MSKTIKFVMAAGAILGGTAFSPASAESAWTYDSEAKTLSEVVQEGTAWVFNVSVTAAGTTIVSVNESGSGTTIDLSAAAVRSVCPPIVEIGIGVFNNLVHENKFAFSAFVFPETLKTIGEGAFRSCNLAVVDLSATEVASIGIAAFNGNAALTTLRLPETLTTIGIDAFTSCTSLQSVEPCFPAALSSIGMTAFTYCPITNALVLSNPGLKKLATNTGYGLFVGSKFPSIDLSLSGIESIEQGTFGGGNTELTTVSLPPTLTYLGWDAFALCSNLKNVDFRSLPTFHEYAFGNAMNLPARFTIDREDKAWLDFIAQSTAAGTFHKWKDASVTDDQRAAYRNMFPGEKTPLGWLNIGYTDRWIVPRPRPGMAVLVY